MICVGGVQELSQLAGRDLSGLDLHRPYVDEITFPNPNGSGGTMRRVKELIDVWFDSGSMPLAQWGYPHRGHEMFKDQFPADYICEAVDQTRGWFYSLHAISTMVMESVSYRNVICLGLILDSEGQKMSKSKGNVVDPWDVLNTHGADAFRWYLYTASPPGESRRFSRELVGEVVSKFWLTLWNTYSFFVTYANIDGWSPDTPPPPVSERDPLDRWVLAELHELVKEVTEAYENYDVPNATRPIQAFVEALSNWYVRLSRRRFWKNEHDSEKLSAYATLYECLVTVAKLIAPAMPFLSEALYRNLVLEVLPDAPSSVHLAQWPSFDEALIDHERIAEQRLIQRLVSLGRAARETVKIGVRQPLAEAQFVVRDALEKTIVERLSDLIMSELNVKSVRVLDEPTYALNPLPQVLGKKFGKDFPRVQKALREGSPDSVQSWARALLAGQNVVVVLDDRQFEVTPDECQVQMRPPEGFAAAEDGGYMAVVNTQITEELALEGLAREVVRRVQTMRKDADYDIADHNTLRYVATARLAQAIHRFADYIQTETLAVSIEQAEPENGYFRREFSPDDKTDIDGESLKLGVKRVE